MQRDLRSKEKLYREYIRLSSREKDSSNRCLLKSKMKGLMDEIYSLQRGLPE